MTERKTCVESQQHQFSGETERVVGAGFLGQSTIWPKVSRDTLSKLIVCCANVAELLLRKADDSSWIITNYFGTPVSSNGFYKGMMFDLDEF